MRELASLSQKPPSIEGEPSETDLFLRLGGDPAELDTMGSDVIEAALKRRRAKEQK